MANAKKFLYTLGIGMVAGAVIGLLYAPAEGADTRRKIKKLKQKISGKRNTEKESLEELSNVLTSELKKINERLVELHQ